ncbi:replication initiation protein [Methylocucumis oryzae]|uniref:Initiator Rep protein WH1 domain-containing protein n=1 Tax=Methylocucumis oryzae TaxID=1632867 RepID=A0A0F3IDW9_9GAMM|nr:replication initiation protein [Methylocucumis oryzae]KJV04961.1 hypothetical protein VZ94_21630 [Methylocucumis oryzae]
MPKTPKTALDPNQTQLPLPLPPEVKASGDAWQINGTHPATVPLPNEVIIKKIEGAYTERDRKLWAFLVAAAWDDLLTVDIHQVRTAKVNDLFQSLGGGDTSTAWIWESAKRLRRTNVEWETLDDEGDCSLLSEVAVNKNAKQSGYLKYAFSPTLRKAIKHPTRFSRLRLHFMIGLSGKYAVSLYMLLESVANQRHAVLDVELNQLREWLKIPEDKLNRWVDVKRRALEPALAQINEKPEVAGFSVVMEEVKEGRAVARVRFHVSKSSERREIEDTMMAQPANKAAQNKSKANNTPPLPTSAYEAARKVAGRLDIYTLEQQWREWVSTKQKPDYSTASFVAFCKKKGGSVFIG